MKGRYLPCVKNTVTEIVRGKKIKKQYYDDNSWGVLENDKVTRCFPDGKIQIYVMKTSNEHSEKLFILSREELPDGTLRRYFSDGHISFEKLSNGTTRSWYENGQKEMEKLPDGTERQWFADGKMSKAKLPDGTILTWDHYHKAFGIGGKLKNEKINNVTTREWHENGQLAYAKSPNGKEIKYDKSGKIIYHATRGVEDTQKYLTKKRVAKQQELIRENQEDEDILQVSARQFNISEKLRRRSLAKNKEQALLAPRSDIKTENEENLNTNLDNLNVSELPICEDYETTETSPAIETEILQSEENSDIELSDLLKELETEETEALNSSEFSLTL